MLQESVVEKLGLLDFPRPTFYDPGHPSSSSSFISSASSRRSSAASYQHPSSSCAVQTLSTPIPAMLRSPYKRASPSRFEYKRSTSRDHFTPETRNNGDLYDVGRERSTVDAHGLIRTQGGHERGQVDQVLHPAPPPRGIDKRVGRMSNMNRGKGSLPYPIGDGVSSATHQNAVETSELAEGDVGKWNRAQEKGWEHGESKRHRVDSNSASPKNVVEYGGAREANNRGGSGRWDEKGRTGLSLDSTELITAGVKERESKWQRGWERQQGWCCDSPSPSEGGREVHDIFEKNTEISLHATSCEKCGESSGGDRSNLRGDLESLRAGERDKERKRPALLFPGTHELQFRLKNEAQVTGKPYEEGRGYCEESRPITHSSGDMPDARAQALEVRTASKPFRVESSPLSAENGHRRYGILASNRSLKHRVPVPTGLIFVLIRSMLYTLTYRAAYSKLSFDDLTEPSTFIYKPKAQLSRNPIICKHRIIIFSPSK